ncbi:MAG: ankyrin repeat domain-containing protein [Gammaproteobacteria bacterium]|nr:ankyrin repeat domain-containing protein [Gammaproteobacteria bacterium]
MTLNDEYRSLQDILIPQLLTKAVEFRVSAYPDFDLAKNELGEDAKAKLEMLAQLRDDIAQIRLPTKDQEADFTKRFEQIKISFQPKRPAEIVRDFVGKDIAFFRPRLNLLPVGLQEILQAGKKQPSPIKLEHKSFFELQLRELFSLLRLTNSNRPNDILLRQKNSYRPMDILLFCACVVGNVEAVKQLIENNANVNCILKSMLDGKTPLHFAAEYGCDEIITLLLKKGAAVNAQDNDGNTPLHLAVKFSKYPAIYNLIQADHIKLNMQKTWKKTPLMIAAEHADRTSANLLLTSPRQSLDEARNILDLHWLASTNAWDMLCVLYKVNETRNILDLHQVASTKAWDMLTMLYKANYPSSDSVNAEKNGFTPLHAAIHHNNFKMVQFIAKSWDIDFERKTDSHDSPLAFAVRCGADNEIVTLLAEKTRQKTIFKKLDLVEHAILTQNFALLRVIENNTPDLLPQLDHTSDNDQINYVAIIATKLKEFEGNQKIWGLDTDKLQSALKEQLEHFEEQVPVCVATVELRYRAKEAIKSGTFHMVDEVVALYKSIKENLPFARPEIVHSAFFKLMEFMVYKCKLIQTVANMDTDSAEFSEVTGLLSEADLKIIADYRGQVTAALLNSDQAVCSDAEEEDVNNNNMRP